MWPKIDVYFLKEEIKLFLSHIFDIKLTQNLSSFSKVTKWKCLVSLINQPLGKLKMGNLPYKPFVSETLDNQLKVGIFSKTYPQICSNSSYCLVYAHTFNPSGPILIINVNSFFLDLCQFFFLRPQGFSFTPFLCCFSVVL